MRILLANLTKMVEDTGGLAKVTSAFANEMQRRGYTVSLVYSDEKEGDFYYPLQPGIPAYDICHYKGQNIQIPLHMKAKRELYRLFSKRRSRTVNNDFAERYLLKNLKEVADTVRPDIIISFQPAASKMLLCDLALTIPVISMSHGDPEDYFHIYPKAEIPSLVKSAVCQVLLPSFAQHIHNHLPQAKTVVIGNSIPQYKEQADLQTQKKQYTIVFVGRLTKNHKRPHLLIEAFGKLAAKYPDWHLELWGDVDQRAYYEELKFMIKNKNLQDRVFLKGTSNEIPNVLQRCDIFAFPSAYEGFGLALGEAMSMGLPAVGYKHCSAVNELIQDNINGFLCEDGAEDLAVNLDRLMGDRALRARMGQAARDSMKQYAPEAIWNAWEKLMEDIVAKRQD
ncbi:MAG: glycosyltransferase [Acidaminococcaceae bacterium]|nr:glycosyltransferase [Acidaminococcaceae bacterium]